MNLKQYIKNYKVEKQYYNNYKKLIDNLCEDKVVQNFAFVKNSKSLPTHNSQENLAKKMEIKE